MCVSTHASSVNVTVVVVEPIVKRAARSPA